MTLDKLNGLAAEDARAAFERCCGARRWVDAMIALRPYKDSLALHAAASRLLESLQRADWLEAFSHHPKIGDVSALRTKFASTAAWAGTEQNGASVASEATLQALADGNRTYEARFGYIFIVCATGKSADEMLALLEARLGNAPDAELAIAAGEQKRITGLRIDKLLGEGGA